MADIEEFDLDEIDEELENWTPDGFNKKTGEYNPEHDAWYPNFDALDEAEKQLNFKEKKNDN